MIIKILAGFIPNKTLRGFFRNFLYSLQIKLKAKQIGNNLLCSKFSTVNKKTVIGNNVKFNGLHISGNGEVQIGNNVVIGFESLIISDTHNYTGTKLPYDGTYISKKTVISDFAWIGARVIILPGSKIGEGAIIQAGAVVHGEIPPFSIAGGNPAKILKMRDINHFKKLKSEKYNIIN